MIARFVGGIPATQGSKSVKGRRRNGSTILVESSEEKLKPWRAAVVAAFAPRGVPREVFPGAVSVALVIFVPRPKSTGLGPWPIGQDTGDLDKYQRAVGDALTTSGVISDDSRIVNWDASKRYANENENGTQEIGAFIRVSDYPARNPYL